MSLFAWCPFNLSRVALDSENLNRSRTNKRLIMIVLECKWCMGDKRLVLTSVYHSTEPNEVAVKVLLLLLLLLSKWPSAFDTRFTPSSSSSSYSSISSIIFIFIYVVLSRGFRVRGKCHRKKSRRIVVCETPFTDEPLPSRRRRRRRWGFSFSSSFSVFELPCVSVAPDQTCLVALRLPSTTSNDERWLSDICVCVLSFYLIIFGTLCLCNCAIERLLWLLSNCRRTEVDFIVRRSVCV